MGGEGKHGAINLILKTLCNSYLPAQPFENVDKSETSTEIDLAISFWHNPYPAKRMLFSATFAANEGTVPAYSPRVIPSFLNVSLNYESDKG